MNTTQTRPTTRRRTTMPRRARFNPTPTTRTPPAEEPAFAPFLMERHTGFLDLCFYPGMNEPARAIQYPTAV